MQRHCTVAALGGMAMEDVVAAHCSRLEGGISPAVRQLVLADGLVGLEAVARVHCQVQGHGTVAALGGMAMEDVVVRHCSRLEGGILPAVRQLVLADGLAGFEVVARVHRQMQRHCTVAALGGVAVEDVVAAHCSRLEGRVAPAVRKVVLTDGLAGFKGIARVHR